MDRIFREETFLSVLALAMLAVAPNLWPAAAAGVAPMTRLATRLLLPSVFVLLLVLVVAAARGHRRLVNRLLAGAAAGLIATAGLEIVRATSFRVFAGMPGSMPELLGVLLTNRIMEGPSTASDILGWAYHFYNGACFGMIFAVLFARRAPGWYLLYGAAIGTGFLLSPAVQAMGIGFMGSAMPSMILTVAVAHLVYALVLGTLSRRWVQGEDWMLSAHPLSAEVPVHP